MKDYLAIGIAAIALVISLLGGGGETIREVTTKVGGQPGPDVTTRTTFQSGMAEGGETLVTATSTQAAATLTDRDMSNSKVISITALDAPALVLNLPASSTWTGLDKPGVAQEWIIDNKHTNAATTTTITAGAGVDIDGTGANDDVINGGVAGRLICWRLSTTFDIRCIVEEFVDAG